VAIDRDLTGTGIAVYAFDQTAGGARQAGDSMAMYDALRERYSPYFWSPVGTKGYWVITSGVVQRDVYQRPTVFSNNVESPFDPDATFTLIPETLDPPLHTKWRQLLSPFFSPRRVASMEPEVRRQCIKLIEDLVERGECDYVADFSQKYPTTIFLGIIGVSPDQLGQFMQWEDDILHTPSTADGLARQARAVNDVVTMFSEVIASRRKNSGQDLISEALTWTIDGRPIPDEDLLSLCLLLFMAGLDTVTNELAYATWHLAGHPADRQAIVDQPALIPIAIEEFLRYYSIVTPARQALVDVEVHGCPIKKGDMVSLPLTAANRDPDEFHDADKVLIDRQENNHAGFGMGPHRCLGSHLARREMRIALEEWHKRIPDYGVVEGVPLPEYIGSQLGLASLPLQWKS
jgi:cytochrome P450